MPAILRSAAAGLALSCAPASAFEGGAYAVAVRLELPHLAEAAATRQVELCLDPAQEGYGLAVLSANNPLARCPLSEIRREGEALTFAIRCPGRNAAEASAAYRLGPDGFSGRIAMRMGAKNMTMTEVQTGRRTGPCRPAGAREAGSATP
jgi:hypothetical protein